jgi:hypothetical protein
MQLFKCEICDKSFKQASHLNNHKKVHDNERAYQQCPKLCAQCSNPIPYKKIKTKKADRKRAARKGNLNSKIFCNSSCAATYNNTHKTHGTRKSRLECYLETKLKELYPTLEFHFNKKDAINSELDVYIPLLKLAFELNGIYHYEPIHGAKKLTEIQNNDHRKFQACLERNIELCIIDSSKLTYFKESNAKPYLEIVQKIVDQKIKAEGIILEDFPVVVYSSEPTTNTSRRKYCKCCSNEFIYKATPKQTFCSLECNVRYKQNNSRIYNKMSSQKKLIAEGLSQGLAINDIAKRIGFKTCAGGYYYTLKKIIEEIKKESAQ